MSSISFKKNLKARRSQIVRGYPSNKNVKMKVSTTITIFVVSVSAGRFERFRSHHDSLNVVKMKQKSKNRPDLMKLLQKEQKLIGLTLATGKTHKTGQKTGRILRNKSIRRRKVEQRSKYLAQKKAFVWKQEFVGKYYLDQSAQLLSYL